MKLLAKADVEHRRKIILSLWTSTILDALQYCLSLTQRHSARSENIVVFSKDITITTSITTSRLEICWAFETLRCFMLAEFSKISESKSQNIWHLLKIIMSYVFRDSWLFFSSFFNLMFSLIYKFCQYQFLSYFSSQFISDFITWFFLFIFLQLFSSLLSLFFCSYAISIY